MAKRQVAVPARVHRWALPVGVGALQVCAFLLVGGWRVSGAALAVFVACVLLSMVVIYLLTSRLWVGVDPQAAAVRSYRTEPRREGVLERPSRSLEKELRRALYDLKNLLAVSVDLNAVHDQDQLCRSLALHFLGLMRASRVAILLPNERGDLQFRRRYGRGISEVELMSLSLDGRSRDLREALSEARPLMLEGRNALEVHLMRAGFALLAPLSHSGLLEGFLLLGPKLSGSPYTEWERQLFSVLANMASVAVANVRLYRELEESAITDALTGLFNRRYFDRRLGQEVALARRLGIPLSLVLVDVDRFKRYNDSFGHPAGDALLRTIADVMKGTSRETDVWARYGGEEFAAILPGVGRVGSRTFADRVRLAVRSLNISSAGGGPVTVSLGAATFPDDAQLVAELVVRADRALYAAKHAGRDRVMLYSEIT